MKEAIQKAIEGGWKPLNLWDDPIHKASTGGDFLFGVKGDEYSKDGRELVFLKLEQITQDPLFWSSLGKAMGWKKKWWWISEWHRFIDHLASGGDAESFFKELMSQ